MRRHGATVAGVTLEELTFRTIYTARNAALQIQAHMLGHVSPLNASETRLAGEYNLRPGPVMRAWEYWNVRLDKVEGNWRGPKSQTRAPKKPAAKQKKAPPLSELRGFLLAAGAVHAGQVALEGLAAPKLEAFSLVVLAKCDASPVKRLRRFGPFLGAQFQAFALDAARRRNDPTAIAYGTGARDLVVDVLAA